MLDKEEMYNMGSVIALECLVEYTKDKERTEALFNDFYFFVDHLVDRDGWPEWNKDNPFASTPSDDWLVFLDGAKYIWKHDREIFNNKKEV